MNYWKIGLLSGLVGLLIGLILAWLWLKPLGKPLFVELVNLRQETVPLISIEHGNEYLQEQIILTQLRPGEKRVLTLNHEPGRGYSIKTQLDGQDIDVCVGKWSKKWTNYVILTNNGIFSKD